MNLFIVKEIDLDDLHNEIRIQPYLMDQIGEELAQKDYERNMLFSRLAKELREKTPNISESKLKNEIECNEEYIQLTLYINTLKNKTETLKHRKASLDKLVDLWIWQYWTRDANGKTKSSNNKKTEEIQNEQLRLLNEKRENNLSNNKTNED